MPYRRRQLIRVGVGIPASSLAALALGACGSAGKKKPGKIAIVNDPPDLTNDQSGINTFQLVKLDMITNRPLKLVRC